MLTKRKMILAAIAVLATSHLCTGTNAQVRERARFALPDIAQATTDRFGRPLVLYNPAACEALGPEMCEFVRAHEYGHIALGHLYDGTPDAVAEAQADCWAAKNASPAAVQAASRYFSSGMFGTSIHGSGPQRARRVASCGTKKRVVRRRVVTRPTTTRSFSTTPASSNLVVRRVPQNAVVRRNVSAPTTVVHRSASSPVVVRRYVNAPVKRVVVRRTR